MQRPSVAEAIHSLHTTPEPGCYTCEQKQRDEQSERQDQMQELQNKEQKQGVDFEEAYENYQDQLFELATNNINPKEPTVELDDYCGACDGGAVPHTCPNCEEQICTAVFDGLEMCGQTLAYYRGVAYCPACEFPDGPHYQDFPGDITPIERFRLHVDIQLDEEFQTEMQRWCESPSDAELKKILQPCNCNCGSGVFHPSTITCPNCNETMEQIDLGLFRCSECYYGEER